MRILSKNKGRIFYQYIFLNISNKNEIITIAKHNIVIHFLLFLSCKNLFISLAINIDKVITPTVRISNINVVPTAVLYINLAFKR